jgi:hypothetical protein
VGGPLAGGVFLIGGAGLTALGVALGAWRDKARWLLPTLVGLLTLGLYLHTLLPSIGEADTLEFQVVAANLGVAHPTGYPLYILLGKLFTWLPLKNVAWRVNLSAATFAAAAAVALYGIVHRLTDRPLLSLLSALAFAFSHTFWSQAVMAEVYTLHNLLVAVILGLLLRGRTEGDARGAGRARRWQAIMFLTGLSLTNHLTTALLVPALGVALLRDRPEFRAGEWLTAGGLFLLGLSVYLFIPLRWPALNDGQAMALRDFAIYVTGGQFHGALDPVGWLDATRWRIVGRLLREPYGWMGLGLAGLGVVNLAMRDRRALSLTGITFLAFVVYGLDYVVADIAVFVMPAHAILAVWMGSGAAFLAGLPAWVQSRTGREVVGSVWRPGVAALMALIPLSRIWTNLPAVDRSRDQGSYDWGRYALSRPLAAEGAILADTKKFAPLYYLQQVEGVRPDLDVVLLGSEELYEADLRRRLEAGQAVYLARYLPHLEAFYLRSVGPLAEVSGAPFDVHGGQVPGENSASSDDVTSFGPGIRLRGAEVDKDPLGRPMYHVTLHWEAQWAVREDLVVQLRLVDDTGEVRWTSEGRRPVNGLYPTNAWPMATPISDYHELTIPAWLPAGVYTLEAGLFRPFGGEGLVEGDGSTAWLAVQELGIEPPSDADPLPHARLRSFDGGAWLTGFDAPGQVAAGAPFVVDTAWQGVGEGERVQFWWAPEAQSADGVGFDLVEGTLRSRQTIGAPSEAGRYTLRVGLVERVGRCGWLAPPRNSCPLLEVRVLPAGEGLANFGERVLLLGGDVTESEARPGDVIQVTLRWRGLRRMREDYTVFVHLVGPDGRLHGQADRWPVEGTYPTSQWPPGREVVDPYEVRLEPDAPPGAYRVEVGWYRLETMQRLQIVGAEGEPLADTSVVGAFDVQE